MGGESKGKLQKDMLRKALAEARFEHVAGVYDAVMSNADAMLESKAKLLRGAMPDPKTLRELAKNVDLPRLKEIEDPDVIAKGLEEVRVFLTRWAEVLDGLLDRIER